jgi:hypothetical protein
MASFIRGPGHPEDVQTYPREKEEKEKEKEKEKEGGREREGPLRKVRSPNLFFRSLSLSLSLCGFSKFFLHF